MKAVIHKPTGNWVQFIEQDWGTCNVPQLFPDSSSLEGIKDLIKQSYDHDMDISDLEMIEVDVIKKSDFDTMKYRSR